MRGLGKRLEPRFAEVEQVMNDPVDNSGGEFVVAEDVVAHGELEVGGEDDALALVAISHDLEEESGAI